MASLVKYHEVRSIGTTNDCAFVIGFPLVRFHFLVFPTPTSSLPASQLELMLLSVLRKVHFLYFFKLKMCFFLEIYLRTA